MVSGENGVGNSFKRCFHSLFGEIWGVIPNALRIHHVKGSMFDQRVFTQLKVRIYMIRIIYLKLSTFLVNFYLT